MVMGVKYGREKTNSAATNCFWFCN